MTDGNAPDPEKGSGAFRKFWGRMHSSLPLKDCAVADFLQFPGHLGRTPEGIVGGIDHGAERGEPCFHTAAVGVVFTE